MRYLRDEKGIALMMALILSLIALAIISALIYFVTQGTVVSGIYKRYQTANEAAKGGTEFFTKEIISRTIDGTALSSLGTYTGIVTGTVVDACFSQKLTTSSTPITNWTNCNTVNILDPKSSPDITLQLSGVPPAPPFNVYVKIVDTIPGNSDTSGLELEGLGVVESGSGIVTPQHFPIKYRIEVQGERATNPDERANLSVLYAY